MSLRYTVELELALPRRRVLELFDDPKNLVCWQPGLVAFEPLDGTPGRPGARSRLVYVMGKRRMELIETITRRDLPDHFDGTYDTTGMHNVVRNQFIEVGPGRTRWVSENEFHFRGAMRLMGFLMKSYFPKQSLKFMEDFKAFAEHGKDVRTPKA